MSNIAIRASNLSKRFQLGEKHRYLALRDVLASAVKAPLRALDRSKSPRSGARELWALRDVSFEIRKGEVVGLIGRNGAGKSTLLKILARVTKPTSGTAKIRGRMGSLLEVGTGFHPELTGRENVYLSGATLGMKRHEIRRKFDEIVAFAEVDKFIDTPIKHYSSGMYVRLAFAVASYMETEILFVDEVLAVGDAQFQKKCFEKFRQISGEGRTIVFVSHNMAAVRNICQSGIILRDGRVADQGEINDMADRYLGSAKADAWANKEVETESFIVEQVSIASLESTVIKTFDDVEIKVRVTAKTAIVDPGLYVGVLTLENQRVTALDLKDFKTAPPMKLGDSIELGFTISEFPILPGTYELEIHVKDMAHHNIEFVPRRFRFDVVESPVYGGRKIDTWYGHIGLRADAFVCPDSLVHSER
jgi:lipopolysaccharide transport system ATP-binding protein